MVENAQSPSNTDRDRLVLKLQSIGDVSIEEEEALRALPMQVRDVPDGADVVKEGDQPSKSCLILTGVLARYKFLPGGGRQIMAFHTPGDIPDLQSVHLKTMDHSIGAFSASRLAFIEHQVLRQLMQNFPNIGHLFWRDTLIDAAIFREWMVGLGRRNAHERIAHLLCEIYLRLKAVGLTQGHEFQFPVTQAELGDALGLTVVHVNRVLRNLREDQLVAMGRNAVNILNWDGLVQLCEFDPLYLHQRRT